MCLLTGKSYDSAVLCKCQFVSSDVWFTDLSDGKGWSWLQIQAAARMHSARALFQRQRAAAAVVQAARRGLLAGRAARAALSAQHSAATVAQAAWRGSRQRASFVALRMAALQASVAI